MMKFIKAKAVAAYQKCKGVVVALVGAVVIGTASVVAAPSQAFATAVDVTGVVTNIGDQVTSISSVGAAVFAVLVAAAIWKWLRRAL
jgi:uncharacterized membrane protein